MNAAPLTASLTLQRAGTPRVGADRIALLQAIDRLGSIASAAREVGLSYKTAWDAVGTMNNLFDCPLVETNTGGKGGGNATLTEAGRGLIDGFSLLEQTLGKALCALQGGIATTPENAINTLWSLMMRTSTRNTFRCTVTQVTEGAVNAEVELALQGGHTLTSVITERSAADMGLAPGTEVFALIKASFVMLAAGEDVGRISACNRLSGTVAARTDGPVNCEITLDLGAGKTITAVITHKAADALELIPGARATAIFKASHVILAMP